MHEEGILIPLFAITFSAFVFGIYLLARHKERMSMVNKGLTSDEIKAYYTKSVGPRDPLISLKWGILFIFGGLAVLLGQFLHEKYGIDDTVILGMVCLFAGLALVIFYGIAAKKVQQ
ncbi:MAG: DUF6249 domain-containing protein [Bacteroidota bacterium]